MTEQELIELWGDGSEFGLSPNDELAQDPTNPPVDAL
jgi:hypothetical protein